MMPEGQITRDRVVVRWLQESDKGRDEASPLSLTVLNYYICG